MNSLFFNDEVDLGLDLLKIMNDDHLINDDYSHYENLKDDEQLYLEPFLIAHYHLENLKAFQLDQILLGYLENRQSIKDIKVFSDEKGVIYLPQIGYLITKMPDNTFLLSFSADNSIELRDYESKNVTDFTFETPMYVSDSATEILKHSHPYITSKLATDPSLSKLMIKDFPIEKVIRHKETLEEGYAIIKKVDPVQYAEIHKLVKKIFFFDCGYFMNFTAMDFQGMLFISTYNAAKPLTFIDTLIHETAHLNLNLVLMNYHEYFTIDPFELKFNSPFFKKSVKRGLYHSIHATYVLAKLVRFYNKLYDAGIFTGLKKYELLALFLLDMRLLKEALSYIKDRSLYTDKGLLLFGEIQSTYEKIAKEKAELINQYKIPEGYDEENAAVRPRFFEADDFLKANNLVLEDVI